MTKDLGKDHLGSLILKLSVPAILSMIAAAVYNLVDRIFVGQIDPLALTAVGITMPLQIAQMSFVLMIGVGSSALMSIYMGRKEVERANRILLTATIYIVISLAGLTILGLFFLERIFALLRVSAEVHPMARDYIVIILLGGVPGLSGYCLTNCIRALGHAKEAMIYITVSSILNIVLDYLFVLKLGYGVKGAAVATVISQVLVTVFVARFFLKHPVGEEGFFHLRGKQLRHNVAEITKNGLPTLYMQVFGTVVAIVLNRYIIFYGGDYHLASITIITSTSHFFLMVVYGVGQGTQAIFGYNYGAGRMDRTKAALKISLGFVIVFTVTVLVAIQAVPRFFIGLFTDEAELMDITVHNIRIYLSMLPMVGIHSIATTYLTSIEQPKMSTLLYILRYGAILIPALFIFPNLMGADGVYLSNAISEGLSGLIALTVLGYFLRRSPEELYQGEDERGKN
ncbi:MAG: MATE family efflux transporter [Filifactor alocis]|nr:MATE family efflux transporter [Filifactor alocis]